MTSAAKLAGILSHFLAFGAWCCYVAGWGLDLGHFDAISASIASGNAPQASDADSLGDHALAAITDPTSDAFVAYLFISLGFLSLLLKLLHSCCSNYKYLGLVAIVFLNCSLCVGGAIAGPKGKSFINCISPTSNTTSTSAGSCVMGANETPTLLMFIGSLVYLLATTFVVGVMYVDAMVKAFPGNKVVPAKASEVWA